MEHKSHDPAAASAIRFLLYTAALLVALSLLPMAVRDGNAELFREGGPVEWLQFSILAALVAVLMAGGLFRPLRRRWCWTLALVAAIGCVRELDATLDALLPRVGWQGPAFLLLAAAAAHVLRGWAEFWWQFREAIFTSGAAILWAGFVSAAIFSQLVGHGDFLRELMGNDYDPRYKRTIEELGELFGYSLLLIGGVETVAGWSGTVGPDRASDAHEKSLAA